MAAEAGDRQVVCGEGGRGRGLLSAREGGAVRGGGVAGVGAEAWEDGGAGVGEVEFAEGAGWIFLFFLFSLFLLPFFSPKRRRCGVHSADLDFLFSSSFTGIRAIAKIGDVLADRGECGRVRFRADGGGHGVVAHDGILALLVGSDDE